MGAIRSHENSGPVSQGPDSPGKPGVAITRPPVVAPKWGISSGIFCPPIGPAFLAASLREAGYSVSIIDPLGEAPFQTNPIPGRPLISYGWSLEQIVRAIPEDTGYVGVSCMFSHEWPVAKVLIKKIREKLPRSVIIAGGEHMTATPEFSLSDCPEINFAVLGEGEETMVELINVLEQGGDASSVAGLGYLQDGKPSLTPARGRVRGVDSIPWPAWDLVPIETYLGHGLSYGVGQGRTMPMMATRGCPYKCTFCSSPFMWTQRWYPRSPKAVADEIEAYTRLYAAENFDFYDLTAIIQKKWIIEFCQEVMQRNLNISWQLPAGTRSEAIDDEVAALLAQSGHRNLVYAPESGSQRILNLIEKKVQPSRMLASMRAGIRNGISVKLNIIVGFPQETHKDILQTYLFLVKTAWIGVSDVAVATFIPYPGSQLFQELHQAGKIKKLDDDFFYGLIVIGDVKSALSFAEKIGGRTLLAYKLFGIFLFYSVSYTSHPQRVFQTLWHLYKGNHETRIEKALSALIGKMNPRRRELSN